METIDGHLYDFPKYYDLIFGSDWKAEFDFLEAAFAKFCPFPVKRVFEPACGTGRLLIKLAQAGYTVGGNDLNPHAVDYCNRRLERSGFPGSATVGDMADFTLKKPVDAAFNLINTFRHLPTEASAESHLRCVADALKPGGIYLLGLHLTPKTVQQCTEESWTATKGSLSVTSRLWSIEVNLKTRVERIGVTYDVTTPKRKFRIQDETRFRIYTAEQMAHLILREPKFEFLAAYDFRHQIDRPITVTPDSEDVIYVLRRR